ncbi:MAG: penicillin-binding protein, partial [Saprospiraceae bacterium]|nr:penicillin-binding protein [Saprospiraceae bacterium]
MKQLLVASIFLVSMVSQLEAQVVGGTAVYEFLTLPASPRLSALGGSMPSVRDGDQMLSISNRALLNPLAHQQIDLNHSFHLLDGQFGYAGYARH